MYLRVRARARKKREKIRKFHTKNTFSFFIKSGGEHIYFDMSEGIEKVKGDVKSAFEKIKGIKNIKIMILFGLKEQLLNGEHTLLINLNFNNIKGEIIL